METVSSDGTSRYFFSDTDISRISSPRRITAGVSADVELAVADRGPLLSVIQLYKIQ